MSKTLFLITSLFILAVIVNGQDEVTSTIYDPYGRPTVQYQNEVFTFLTESNMSVWKLLPWNKITTLCIFMDPKPDLIRLAHKNKVKVVKGVGFVGGQLSNGTARKLWIQKNVAMAKKYNLDGVNVDFEETIAKGNPKREYLTLLVQETTQAFHSNIAGSQVTIDLPWTPGGYGRYFDAFGLAFACDFLVIMDYDLENMVYAVANAGFDKVSQGVKNYENNGIPASKLVLAMPWYGYKFECSVLTSHHVCMIKKGIEVDYKDIVGIYFKKYAISKILWDEKGSSPYFDIKVNGVYGQIRYDNPLSLRLKYDLAVTMGLRGVGMWTVNAVDYTNSTEAAKQRAQMWNVIPYSR